MNPDRGDQIDQIVSLLLDELFKDFLWRQRVEEFRGSHPQVIFTARPPELILLSNLMANAGDGERTLVYPGPPLGLEEIRLFTDVVSGVRLCTLADWLLES